MGKVFIVHWKATIYATSKVIASSEKEAMKKTRQGEPWMWQEEYGIDPDWKVTKIKKEVRHG